MSSLRCRALPQAMMPCKTPACLGRANGCIFAHNPDEQTHSRREYEDLIGQATQRDMEPGMFYIRVGCGRNVAWPTKESACYSNAESPPPPPRMLRAAHSIRGRLFPRPA
jgi:hypothetical protein